MKPAVATFILFWTRPLHGNSSKHCDSQRPRILEITDVFRPVSTIADLRYDGQDRYCLAKAACAKVLAFKSKDAILSLLTDLCEDT
jgi:hypothetical protein